MERDLRAQLETIFHGPVEDYIKMVDIPRRYWSKIIQVAIVNILYHRMPVEQEGFTSNSYLGISYIVPKYDSIQRKSIQDPFMSPIINYLPGIVESISQTYFCKLFLHIKNSNKKIVESYSFRLTYTISFTENSFAHKKLKIGTLSILKMIKKFQVMKKLDRSHYIQVELFFKTGLNDEFSMPGFNGLYPEYLMKTLTSCFLKYEIIFGAQIPESKIESSKICIENALWEIKHWDVKGAITQDEIDRRNLTKYENSSGNNKERKNKRHYVDEVLERPNNQEAIIIYEHPSTAVKFCEDGTKYLDRTIHKRKPDIITEFENEERETANFINCICKIIKPIKKMYQIKCQHCPTRYHLSCAGYLKLNKHLKFVCMNCRIKDKFMLNATVHYESVIAQARLIISFVVNLKQVPWEFLNSLLDGEKIQVLDSLKYFDIVDGSVKNLEYGLFCVNKKKIHELIPVLFLDCKLQTVGDKY